MNPAPLKEFLLAHSATLAGVGDVTAALPPELSHLRRAVAIAVDRRLGAETAELLMGLQKKTGLWLKETGYRFLSIPPDSDRRTGKFVSKLYGLFSHKTAATCAGLGWVGKNGLVINEAYGPRLSWATVLTDAPLAHNRPVEKSGCGNCGLCEAYCPSGAITGRHWSVDEPYTELVRYEKCRSLKKSRRGFDERPNCGLCINICPFGRQCGPEKIYGKDEIEEELRGWTGTR